MAASDPVCFVVSTKKNIETDDDLYYSKFTFLNNELNELDNLSATSTNLQYMRTFAQLYFTVFPSIAASVEIKETAGKFAHMRLPSIFNSLINIKVQRNLLKARNGVHELNPDMTFDYGQLHIKYNDDMDEIYDDPDELRPALQAFIVKSSELHSKLSEVATPTTDNRKYAYQCLYRAKAIMQFVDLTRKRARLLYGTITGLPAKTNEAEHANAYAQCKGTATNLNLPGGPECVVYYDTDLQFGIYHNNTVYNFVHDFATHYYNAYQLFKDLHDRPVSELHVKIEQIIDTIGGHDEIMLQLVQARCLLLCGSYDPRFRIYSIAATNNKDQMTFGDLRTIRTDMRNVRVNDFKRDALSKHILPYKMLSNPFLAMYESSRKYAKSSPSYDDWREPHLSTDDEENFDDDSSDFSADRLERGNAEYGDYRTNDPATGGQNDVVRTRQQMGAHKDNQMISEFDKLMDNPNLDFDDENGQLDLERRQDIANFRELQQLEKSSYGNGFKKRRIESGNDDDDASSVRTWRTDGTERSSVGSMQGRLARLRNNQRTPRYSQNRLWP